MTSQRVCCSVRVAQGIIRIVKRDRHQERQTSRETDIQRDRHTEKQTTKETDIVDTERDQLQERRTSLKVRQWDRHYVRQKWGRLSDTQLDPVLANIMFDTAVHSNTLRDTLAALIRCSTLQHTATHSNTQQHTATHSNTLQRTLASLIRCSILQHIATHCNTLQHTATHLGLANTLFELLHLVEEVLDCFRLWCHLMKHTHNDWVISYISYDSLPPTVMPPDETHTQWLSHILHILLFTATDYTSYYSLPPTVMPPDQTHTWLNYILHITPSFTAFDSDATGRASTGLDHLIASGIILTYQIMSHIRSDISHIRSCRTYEVISHI